MGKRARRKRRAMKRIAERMYATHPRYYLGYGSNHNMAQMQWRCPDAETICKASLFDWKLVFSGVLTIEPEEGKMVPLSVWKVSAGDIAALDRYEGYPHLYTKMYLDVDVQGTKHKGFTYLLNKPYGVYPPAASYYKDVLEGYHEWGFDEEILEEARAYAFQNGTWATRRNRTYEKWTEYIECEKCHHWFPPDEVVRSDESTYSCWECALGDKWKPEWNESSYDDQTGKYWPDVPDSELWWADYITGGD